MCVQIFYRLFSRLSVTNFHYLHFNVNILLNKSVRLSVRLCIMRLSDLSIWLAMVQSGVYSLIDEYIYMVIKQCLNVGKYVDMSVRSSICLTVCLSVGINLNTSIFLYPTLRFFSDSWKLLTSNVKTSYVEINFAILAVHGSFSSRPPPLQRLLFQETLAGHLYSYIRIQILEISVICWLMLVKSKHVTNQQ